MGSAEGSPCFRVFDGVKIISSTPEALMAGINTAIANLECTRAAAHLDSLSSSLLKIVSSDASVTPQHDAKMADEDRMCCIGCWQACEAFHSLNLCCC